MCSDIFLKNREVFAPEIGIGNKPIDGGYYLFEKEELEAFLKMRRKRFTATQILGF